MMGFDGEGNVVCQSWQSTMTFEDECFDLETGAIVQDDFVGCPGADWDFKFAYNSGQVPHAVIFQNRSQVVQIAYSGEAFDDVTGADVAGLSFTSSLVDVAFSQVAVLRTGPGNYFKVGPVSEGACTTNENCNVTFRWLQLVLP
ncbi:MAG: hypothetical protein Q8O42_17405 [Acidobacteriota bacterium]|nr:hypothetical protein [Acidobacteriota bacterium]